MVTVVNDIQYLKLRFQPCKIKTTIISLLVPVRLSDHIFYEFLQEHFIIVCFKTMFAKTVFEISSPK